MTEQERPDGDGFAGEQHAAADGSAPAPEGPPADDWSRTAPQPGFGVPAAAQSDAAATDPTGHAGATPAAPGWAAPRYPQQSGGAPGPYGQPGGYPPQGPYRPQGQYPPHLGYQPQGGFGATAPQPLGGGSWGYPGAGQAPESPPERHGGRLRIGLAGLVAGALIGGGVGAGVVAFSDHGSTQTTSAAPEQNVVIKDPTNATSVTAAAAKAAPSVVTIYVANGQSAGSGSGVVLTPDGYVLTNNHVVTLEGSGTGAVQVRAANGALYDADVVGTDPIFDLAVIKLKGANGLKPATFGNSDKVQVGDLAVAIGAPLGLSNTVTDGIISATNRAVETGQTQNDATVIDALQTDAAINPGNSGGALVNGGGEVVGINSAIATVASQTGGQDQSGNIGVGFAIPSNTAKRIADELVKNGKSTHAVLGVSARTQSDGANPEVGTGAQVVQVQPGGPAAGAGLQPGDVITAVGNRAVTSSTELTAAIRSSTPGGQVTLTVRHGNATHKVDVTLARTTG